MNEQAKTGRAQPKRKKGLLRWLLRLGVLGLLFVGVLVFFAPTIASSGWGKARITGAINGTIAGTVSIDALELRWGSGQTITGVTLSDPDGKAVVTLGSVSTEASLWSLVRGGRDLGKTSVEGLVVDLVAGAEGSTNLQRAIAPTEVDEETDTDRQDQADADAGTPMTASLVVNDAKLTLTQAGRDPVYVERLRLTADLPAEGPIAFDLSADARQAGATGKVVGDGTYDVDANALVGKLNVSDLPTAGLDALLNQGGVLIEAVGERIESVSVTAAKPDAQGAQAIAVVIKSPRLSGTIDATLADGELTGQGHLSHTTTPALVAALVRHDEQLKPLKLDGDVLVNWQLAQGKLPAGPFDPTKVRGRMIATVSRGGLTYVDEKQPTRFEWDGISLTAATDPNATLADGVRVSLNSKTRLDGQPGAIDLKGKAENLFDEEHKPQIGKANVDAELAATGLPIALADRLAKQDGKLVEALGDKLNVNATAQRAAADKPIEVKVNADSATLVAKLGAYIDEKFVVQDGSTVELKPTAELLKRYVTDASGYAVATDRPMVLTINRLACPMPSDEVAFMQPDKTQLDVEVALPQMAVTDPTDAAQPIGPLVVSGGKVDVKADKLSAPRIGVVANVSSHGDGLVAAYGARQLWLKASADTTLDGAYALGDIDLVVAVGNRTRDLQPIDNVEVKARIAKGFERLGLREPTTINYRVMPAMLAAEKGQATLKRPTPVVLRLNRLDVPLKGFALSGVKADASFKANELELAGDPRFEGAKLSDLAGSVALDGGAKLAVALGGTTLVPNAAQPGSVKADVNLSQWLDKDGKPALGAAKGKAVVTLDDVPAPFVDALAQQGGKLPAVLGDAVDLAVNYDAAGRKKTLTVRADSAHLKARGAFEVTEADALSITEPLGVTWVMTPAAHAQLTRPADGKPAPMRLTKPVTFNVKAAKLSDLPMGGERFDLRKLAVGATVDATMIVLQDAKTQHLTTITALKGRVDAAPLGSGLSAKFNGIVGYVDPKAADGEPVTGTLDFNAALRDLFNEQGKLDTAALTADINAKLAELPVVALDQLAAADGRVLALLGDRAQVDLDAKIVKGSGPFTFATTSPNATAKLVGRYAAGVVTLDEDATATAKVTRELGQKLLKDINILLESAYSSDEPIKLTVPAQNFKLDLNEFDITKVNAEQVKLELGTIKLDNSGLLPGILSAVGRRNTDQMEAQFTPLVTTMKEGKLHYDRRLDMLVDGSFHIANFGDVDLKNRRLHMIVGLTADTLDKTFGAEGLPADTIYQIPVTGPIDKPKVDVAGAAVELATLKERAKLAKKNPLVGALLEGLLKDMRKDNLPVPPKSQDPLPWVVKAPPRQAEPEPEQPKRPEKKREKSLEEQLIEEGLKSIFD